MWFIIQAMIIGFSIAAPGGSVGFLCVEETLLNGIFSGIIAGLASATADMLYGVFIAFCLKMSHFFLLQHQTFFSYIGAFFLCCLGINRFFEKPPINKNKIMHSGLLKTYVLTFTLTLVDVSTILEYLCLFTGLDIEVDSLAKSLLFVSGIFVGSLVWWIILSCSVGIYKKKISEEVFQYINYCSGIIILIFGLYGFSKVWQ